MKMDKKKKEKCVPGEGSREALLGVIKHDLGVA
jgi:hypothetical protein